MNGETIIKATDMSGEMQEKIIKEIIDEEMASLVAGDALERDVAQRMKQKLDREQGPRWHVVVGKNFGSFVTHEQGHFLYAYHGPWAILLFKTA